MDHEGWTMGDKTKKLIMNNLRISTCHYPLSITHYPLKIYFGCLPM